MCRKEATISDGPIAMLAGIDTSLTWKFESIGEQVGFAGDYCCAAVCSQEFEISINISTFAECAS